MWTVDVGRHSLKPAIKRCRRRALVVAQVRRGLYQRKSQQELRVYLLPRCFPIGPLKIIIAHILRVYAASRQNTLSITLATSRGAKPIPLLASQPCPTNFFTYLYKLTAFDRVSLVALQQLENVYQYRQVKVL